MRYLITADVNEVAGYIQSGHFEGDISEEQYQAYLKLSTDKERENFIWDNCSFCLDTYELTDCGGFTDIKIEPWR